MRPMGNRTPFEIEELKRYFERRGGRLFAVRVVAALLVCFLALLGEIPALAAEEAVTIKLWDFHVHDKKLRKSIFDRFNKQNPEIKVVYTTQVGDAPR